MLKAQRIYVGSLNGPKLEAVRSAFDPFVTELEVVGRAVESGVSEQPVGFEEIALGARNRARAAYASGACDLAAGIEDGLVPLSELGHEVLNIGVAILTDGKRESVGLSSGFAYPPECLEPALKKREPIGGVFDRYWQQSGQSSEDGPSGLSVGNIGRLSLGALPRSEYGRQAVVCALVRFLHPEMYPQSIGSPAALTGTQADIEESKIG
ncbi:MAG: hypothetical protein CL917_04420 [Deltaproteobacteria bacterium]|nr:hypothetical protein [Deltaproteobacteria bacterium]